MSGSAPSCRCTSRGRLHTLRWDRLARAVCEGPPFMYSFVKLSPRGMTSPMAQTTPETRETVCITCQENAKWVKEDATKPCRSGCTESCRPPLVYLLDVLTIGAILADRLVPVEGRAADIGRADHSNSGTAGRSEVGHERAFANGRRAAYSHSSADTWNRVFMEFRLRREKCRCPD